MGIHTQTRPVIVNAIWQYIKVRERKSGQFEPTLLVHVQVVCAVKESFVHQSQALSGKVVNWMGRSVTAPTFTIIARGLGFSRPQLETRVFSPGTSVPPSRKFNHAKRHCRYSSLARKESLLEEVTDFTVTISDPQFTRFTRARVHQLRQILSTGEYSVHL